MNIIGHLEKYLGKIEYGWSAIDNPNKIQVAAFIDKPFTGAITYSSIGLSNFVMYMPNDRFVRQEILFSTYREFASLEISSFLLSFCDYLLFRRRALLRGDLVGPSSPIIKGFSLNSIYSSLPVIFPDNLAVYNDSTPSTVIVWLIPLLEQEANFIKQKGSDHFESILENADPDLLDFNRKAIL